MNDKEEKQLDYALHERDMWMQRCLDAESRLRAYEEVFENCRPVRHEFRCNYSPSMIRLRWALDRPTELDRAVRDRGINVKQNVSD